MDSGTTTAAVAASPPADAATAATSLAPPSATLLALQRSHALGFVRLLLSPFSRGLALSLSRAYSLVSWSSFSRLVSRPCSSIWLRQSFRQHSFFLIHLDDRVISPTFIRSHPLLFLRVFLDFRTTVFFIGGPIFGDVAKVAMIHKNI
jgi:hypothetical protein